VKEGIEEIKDIESIGRIKDNKGIKRKLDIPDIHDVLVDLILWISLVAFKSA